MNRRLLSLMAIAFATALGVVPLAQSQTDAPAVPPSESDAEANAAAFDLVIDELDVRRSAAESDASLPSDVKSLVLELFSRAIAQRRRAAATAAETAALAERIAGSPERIEALIAQVDETAPEPDTGSYGSVTLDELASRAREKRQELAAAREALTREEKALAALNAMGPTLSEDIAAGKLALREMEGAEKESASSDLPVLNGARKAYLEAREINLREAIAQAELKLANYQTLMRLATLERDAIAVLVPRLDAEREALVAAVDAGRADEAREARVEAQRAAVATASLPDAVTQLAADGAQLGVELEAVTLDTARVAEQLGEVERRASELETELTSIQERLKTVGATEAVGRILYRQLRTFDGVETSRAKESARSDAILRATERRLELDEQRRELADSQALVDAVFDSIPEGERARFAEALLREQIASLVAAKRATVDELHQAYGRYLTQLSSHDAAERHLAATGVAILDFVRRELLWVRVTSPVSMSDVGALADSLARLLAPSSWRRLLGDASAAAANKPALASTGLLIVLGLIAVRPWARRRLVAVGELTRRIRTDAFRHTILALLLTVILAGGWPSLLLYVGWLVEGTDGAAPFSYHLSGALWQAGLGLAIFSALRWLLYSGGLATRHFGWPEPTGAKLMRELRWLMPLAIVGIVSWVYAARAGPTEAALSRYALMAFSAALCVFNWRVFHRNGALMTMASRGDAHAFAPRTWLVWFPVLLAIPAANFVAAGVGYLYTARAVMRLLFESGYVIVGVWVLRDLLLRWFTLTERRLRFEQALKLREETRAERQKQKEESVEPHAPEVAEVEQPRLDPRELGEQARAVVQAAVLIGILLSLWAVWGDLLPALNVLKNVDLPFSRAAIVSGVERSVAVSLADAVIAVIAVGATLYAAKNLSGLLGFTVLRRLSMDAGAQYAIVTLCQYALVAAGVLYAFSALGMQWSKLQWLVAALSVGLGFGLQEIVANFVSGIILLLERPVRVGDFVTVGNATGTVARIRIRATTIMDLDMKELVVPNKEFITGRLLNWTLSSEVVRLVVPVGIAYGSDARRARELMLEAAAEAEHVLDDPPPNVIFSSFGDNALGLELRSYVSSMDHYVAAITSLHDAIYEKFTEASIVIAFPQRDVHLDTSAPLDIRLLDAAASERGQRRGAAASRDGGAGEGGS
jgi:potassium efflux system protein